MFTTLCRSLATFGRSWACSWAALGRSWAALGCSWAAVGRSWALLGGSGPQEPQRLPEVILRTPPGAPSWDLKWIKIDQTSIKHLSKISLIFCFFLIFGPSWIDVGANLPPFFQPKIIQNCIKSVPKGIENLIDVRLHFSMILASFWDPSWAHVGHFFVTSRPQDPPKEHQKLIPTLKKAENTSWTRPGALQTSILAPLVLHFAPPDLEFDAPRPRFLNVLGLFLC